MSTTPVTPTPKPAVRALIVDYTPDPPTITETKDRELIAKVIRQGGRHVWLDVSDADSGTLDWLSQTLNVSAVLLALDPPFYEREPFLAFGLPALAPSNSVWDSKPALIAIRGGTLLTLTHSPAVWNDTFNRTGKIIPNWREHFNGTLCELLTALVLAPEQAADNLVRAYDSIRSRFFESKRVGDVPAALHDLLAWQSDARRLHDRLGAAGYTLSSLDTHPAFQSDQDTTWKLLALADRWESASQKLSRAIDDARDLPGAMAAQQTAQINARIRAITIALFIALPILVATPWALVLPVQSEVRLAAWAVLMIVAVGVSLALGIRAKLF
ncbi:MAG: CorA family divalent cation transporter [Aggregatilineales bacterium]